MLLTEKYLLKLAIVGGVQKRISGATKDG